MFFIGLIDRFYIYWTGENICKECIRIISLAQNYIKEEYRKTFLKYGKLWICNLGFFISFEEREKMRKLLNSLWPEVK